jgi:hypothetical protein
MIDHNGQRMPPLFALLHGGGGGLPVANVEILGRKKEQGSAYHFKTAFGSAAATMESFSLIPSARPPAVLAGAVQSPRKLPSFRRPSPACCASTRASTQQTDRAWTIQPGQPPRFKDGAASARSTLMSAEQVRPRPTTPRTGPPQLATSARPRAVPIVPHVLPKPPSEARRRSGGRRRQQESASAGASGGSSESEVPSSPASGALPPRSAAAPIEREGGGVDIELPDAKAPTLGSRCVHLVVLPDGNVSARVRIGGDNLAATRIQATYRGNTTRRQHRDAVAEAEDERAREHARSVLRENEEFFEQMRKRLDEELREERAAVRIQAASRGRATRATGQ